MRILTWMGLSVLVVGTALSQNPVSSVSGRVLKYATLEPVADVTVELIGEAGTSTVAPTPAEALGAAALRAQDVLQGGTPLRRATTAADGSFTLSDVTPGEYRIYGTAQNGYLPAEYGQRSPTGVGMPITLEGGRNTTGITLTITPTSSISGRITDANGDPVVYASVLAGRIVYRQGVRTLEAAQSSLTNDRGEYRIFWLPPGSYILTAIPLEMRQYTMPATPPARFGGREHISAPLIALKPSPDGGAPTEVTYMPAFHPGVADLASSQRIAVRPGESVRADINVGVSEVPSLRVRGVVVSDGQQRGGGGSALTLVPRFVEGHSVQPPRGNANSEGVFEIRGVVPGSYFLFAGSAVLPLEVSDKGLDNVRIQLVSPATISWNVTMESVSERTERNEVPGNVQVSLTRDPNLVGAPSNFGGRGGAGGTGTLTNVPFGDYRVNVSNLPRNAYVKSIRLGAEDVLRNGLHVFGPIQNPLEIVASGNAAILSGRVIDNAGRPVVNSTIAMIPPQGLRQSRLDLYKTTMSRAEGRFEIDGVAPGDYKIFAWDDVQTGDWYNPEFMQNQEIRGTTVRVAEGATETLNLPVIPADGSLR